MRRCFKRTVTGDDKELVIVADVVNRHVGESSDDLLLGRKVGALLELEVANGSAQCEIAVDPPKVDEATCSTNACLLALILRLVIE